MTVDGFLDSEMARPWTADRVDADCEEFRPLR